MELQISNNAKRDKRDRTAMSQQALVNALLSEKQAVNTNGVPQQQQQPAIVPAMDWGRQYHV